LTISGLLTHCAVEIEPLGQCYSERVHLANASVLE